MKIKNALKWAFPLTLPVMAGYLFLGMGFGVLLESKGYSFIWSLFMAVILYAGSMQYVAIDLLSSGATLIATAIITFTVQIRHLFYGLSLIDKYKDIGKKKFFMVYELTDETYSLVAAAKIPDAVDKSWVYFFISILDHVYWIVGCCLGSLLGSLVDFNTKGVDFVMTALFIVIFTNQWLDTREHRPALLGLACSLVCLLIWGSGKFIIPAMISILLFLTILRKPLERRGDKLENS